MIVWRQVESSNVKAIGWDQGRRLFVRFKSGAVYAYPGVSRQRAVACAYARRLTRAASVGRYINQRIKPHYQAVKIT